MSQPWSPTYFTFSGKVIEEDFQSVSSEFKSHFFFYFIIWLMDQLPNFKPQFIFYKIAGESLSYRIME